MTLVVGKRTPEYSGHILTWRPSASFCLLWINGGFVCTLFFLIGWVLVSIHASYEDAKTISQKCTTNEGMN